MLCRVTCVKLTITPILFNAAPYCAKRLAGDTGAVDSTTAWRIINTSVLRWPRSALTIGTYVVTDSREPPGPTTPTSLTPKHNKHRFYRAMLRRARLYATYVVCRSVSQSVRLSVHDVHTDWTCELNWTPVIWNSLPAALRHCETVLTFKNI